MAHQNSSLLTSLTAPGADNATRAGSTFTTTERRALFLKLFSGEMFKGFQRNTIARDLVTKTNYVEPGGTQIRVGSSTNASDALNAGNLVSAFYDAAAALVICLKILRS